MRRETPYLCDLEPDLAGVEYAALDRWIDHQRAPCTRRGGRFAVEVCWIAKGVIACRTYQVKAADETRAARIACKRASKALGKRATRIEAVDIEGIQWGGGHE